MVFLISGCQKKAPINDLTASPKNSSTTMEGMTFLYITNPERVEHNTYSIVKSGDWTEKVHNNSIVYLPPDGKPNDNFSEKIIMTVAFLPENENPLYVGLPGQ